MSAPARKVVNTSLSGHDSRILKYAFSIFFLSLQIKSVLKTFVSVRLINLS